MDEIATLATNKNSTKKKKKKKTNTDPNPHPKKKKKKKKKSKISHNIYFTLKNNSNVKIFKTRQNLQLSRNSKPKKKPEI